MGCCEAKPEVVQEKWATDRSQSIVPPATATADGPAGERDTSVASVQPAMLSTGYVAREPDRERMRDRILAKALKSTLDCEVDDDVHCAVDADAESNASSTSGAAVDQRMLLPVKAKDRVKTDVLTGMRPGKSNSPTSLLPGHLETVSNCATRHSATAGSGRDSGFAADSLSTRSGQRPDAAEELWKSTLGKKVVSDRARPYSKLPMDLEARDDTTSIATTGGSYRRQPTQLTIDWVARSALEVVGVSSPVPEIFEGLPPNEDCPKGECDAAENIPKADGERPHSSSSTEPSGLTGDNRGDSAPDPDLMPI